MCRWLFAAMLSVTVAATTSCNQLLAELNTPVSNVRYYLAAEVDNPAQQAITESVLYQIEDTANAGDHVRVDYLVDKGTHNVYSSGAERNGLWALAETLPTLPCDEQSLSSALYTIANLANQHPEQQLRAIVVSAGTSDKAVIDSLVAANQKLAQYHNLHVAVVGISPKHRATFSRAFSPIQERTWFAGTTQEIDALFRSYQEGE